MSTARIINYISFPILVAAALLGLYWVWGVMFLGWLVPTVISGQAHLVFEVYRHEDPVLFWAVGRRPGPHGRPNGTGR